MSSKPAIPRGTRDFGPALMRKRNFIFDTIRKHFHRYGFMQLETPSMENLSVLTGKYGDEGDQLIFKILNSGNFLDGVQAADMEAGYKSLTPKISEKALRYDLTVPLARFVVTHRHEITFPFRRYQMQPVWRADRPQKGRYREFYQCDADIIGTRSLLADAELALLASDVLNDLGIKDHSIKINNRKVLAGLSVLAGKPGAETDFCVAIDKLDKIGWEAVAGELQTKGFDSAAIESVKPLLEARLPWQEQLALLEKNFKGLEIGLSGLQELQQLFRFILSANAHAQVEPDFSLARGLTYYTGAIFEIKALGVAIGSISGGGRYDNLTGLFGLPDVPGVGISFGVDRIFDVMEELGLFSQLDAAAARALLVRFDDDDAEACLKLVQQLRNENIAVELYPEPEKLKKQFAYADNLQIPFVLMFGADERAQNKLKIKNMQSGEQQVLSVEEVISLLKIY